MKNYFLFAALFIFVAVPVVSSAACINLTTSLRFGSRDNSTSRDVTLLQDFLREHTYLDSESTGYFGSLTQAAVSAFQTDNTISATPPGFAGPFTRARIQNISCVVSTSTVPVVAAPVATSTAPVATTSLSFVGTGINPVTISSPSAGELIRILSIGSQGYPIKLSLRDRLNLPSGASMTLSLENGPTQGVLRRLNSGDLFGVFQYGQMLETFSSLDGSTTQPIQPGTYRIHVRLYSDIAETKLISEALSGSFILVSPSSSITQIISLSPVRLSTTTVSRDQKDVTLLNMHATVSADRSEITGMTLTNLSPDSDTNLFNLGIYDASSTYLGGPSQVSFLNNSLYKNATQYQFYFPSSVLLQNGKITTLILKGNISSTATGTIRMSINGVFYPSGAPATFSGTGVAGDTILIK